MFFNAVAIIMAGGKSSRMKEDKALLPFGTYSSLSEYQYTRLSKFFSKVFISAKEDKFDFEVNVIEDLTEDSSPLLALVSIFETLDCDEFFILSVDAPFVSEELIIELYKNSSKNDDVIVAESPRGLEPLCAIYRRSFLTSAKDALAKNNHRLQSLFNDLNVKKVFIEEEGCFMNLNYPHEYKEATVRLKREN